MFMMKRKRCRCGMHMDPDPAISICGQSPVGTRFGSTDPRSRPRQFKRAAHRRRSAMAAAERRDLIAKCQVGRLPPALFSLEERAAAPPPLFQAMRRGKPGTEAIMLNARHRWSRLAVVAVVIVAMPR
jgi:hypothetical protein